MKKLLVAAVAVAASVASFTAVAQTAPTVTKAEMAQLLGAHQDVNAIQRVVKAALIRNNATGVVITTVDVQDVLNNCSAAGSADKCSAFLADRQTKKVGLAGKTPLSFSDVQKLQSVVASGNAGDVASTVNDMLAARS